MWLHLSFCAFYEVTSLKSSPLSGEERTEKQAVNQQSSSEVPNQEKEPSAVSRGQEECHKEVPSPSGEETFPQDPSYQSAKEEPATPDGEDSQDSGRSQITLTLTALSQGSEGEACVDECPPTVPDVSEDRLSDLSHAQDTVESSESHQSDSQSEAAVAADAECYKREGNTDVISLSSAAAAAAAAHEQEDVQPNCENGLSHETDVCVDQGI